ncbi:MAG: hypothetical protein ACLPSY_06575 [Steroidobacteraceae bacterium]
MKSKTWDEAILADHRSSIRETSAREAFDTLVAAAIELPGFDTAPGWHREIRDFAYIEAALDERLFAFIVNRRDLLFYITRPGLDRVTGGFAALRSRFGTAAESAHREWTVRIASKEDAERLNAFLFSRSISSQEQGGRIPDLSSA